MPNFRPKEFCEALASAVDAFDRPETARLVEELTAHLGNRPDAYPLDEAKTILTLLRRKRYFDLMQRAADAFIRGGQAGFRVRREYAQAMLDQGNLMAGIEVLRRLALETEGDPADDPELAREKRTENAEAWGLIGRAYKQLYMDADAPEIPRNQQYLREAAAAYHRVYVNDPDEFVWQGINSVALMRRADADGVDLGSVGGPGDTKLKSDAIATQVLARIQALDYKQRAAYWDFATALEACVGLGRHDEALEWLALYLRARGTDAFECASTHRQLTEVWRLRPTEPPGDRILPALRSAIITKSGGELALEVQDAAISQLAELTEDAGYEKILGVDTFKTVKWLEKCMTRARSVARIEDSNGNPAGTGFLVCGSDLHPDLPGEYLLTNNHVVSTIENERDALRPEQAVVRFELVGDREFEVKEGQIVWESGRMELDATLIELGGPTDGIGCVPLAAALPVNDGKQRAYVIGHPQGRKLSFSIHDNHILDYDSRLVHYRSPTEPGSSGSPVFSDAWDLIALHHSGSRNTRKLSGDGTYPANEGISLPAIKSAIAEWLSD